MCGAGVSSAGRYVADVRQLLCSSGLQNENGASFQICTDPVAEHEIAVVPAALNTTASEHSALEVVTNGEPPNQKEYATGMPVV